MYRIQGARDDTVTASLRLAPAARRRRSNFLLSWAFMGFSLSVFHFAGVLKQGSGPFADGHLRRLLPPATSCCVVRSSTHVRKPSRRATRRCVHRGRTPPPNPFGSRAARRAGGLPCVSTHARAGRARVLPVAVPSPTKFDPFVYSSGFRYSLWHRPRPPSGARHRQQLVIAELALVCALGLAAILFLGPGVRALVFHALFLLQVVQSVAPTHGGIKPACSRADISPVGERLRTSASS